MASETTESISHEGNTKTDSAGFLSPDVSMLILTWVTFFLLLIVLYKLAWKPILSALDAREKSIRDAVGEAEKIRQELLKIDEVRKRSLKDAEEKSKEIIVQARNGAVEAARIIHEKSKEEAQILLENARREIKNEVEKAQADLRQESAQIAVLLAGKLIEKNLDDEKNRKLIDELIRDI